MRLATFNIQHGRTAAGRVEPERVAEACAGLAADLLALQEVDAGARRSHRAHLARMAGEAAGMAGVFGASLGLRGGGRYGNALLVRGTLDDVEVVDLPGWPRAEPRVAVLAAAVLDGGAAVSVVATHLGVRGEGAIQLPAVVGHLAARPPPRVLLGDLNLSPEEVEPVVAAAGLTLAGGPPTYPAPRPRRRIDHVAAAGLVLGRVTVPEAPVGDHRPLVVDADVR